MMRKTAKKKKKNPTDSGYSKGIFYAMAFLCLASVLTACVTLGGLFDKNDSDKRSSNLDTNSDVVRVVPKQTELDADAEITLINPPVEDERWLHLGVTEKDLNDQIGQAIADHLDEHNDDKHTFSPHYTLFKCHQLGSNTFSCKIVQGENVPLPKESEVPTVELTEEQEEKALEVEPEIKKEKKKSSSWNPFD
tara:strand:+ start:104 stop:682 length:579 start_codon:yes stop_codon:yes gene_type:complete